MGNKFIVNSSDQQLDELQAYAPPYTQQNAENIKQLFMKKTAPKRKIGIRGLLIAAIITICTTSVLAVGVYTNSFERLIEVLGEDQAAMLQPVDVHNISDRRATVAGFHIDVVAMGVSYNAVDLFLTLEDMLYNRLDGDFWVATRLYIAGERSFQSSPIFSDVIDRALDGTVTLHTREVFHESIADKELELLIDGIFYNSGYVTYELDFNLSSIVEHATYAWLWDTPILQPHMHDISIEPESVLLTGSTRISSIGMIDGRLHIQEQHDAIALRNWRRRVVTLINPEGETVYPLRGTRNNTQSVSFGIDQQGNIYNNQGHNFTADFPYREYIFEVDILRLAEYRLEAQISTERRVYLNWTASFEVEVPDAYMKLLIADELNITLERFGSTISEVRVSPYGVIIFGYALPDREWVSGGLGGILVSNEWVFPQVKIHTSCSSILYTYFRSRSLVVATNSISETLAIEGDMINLDNVVAVEIDGHMIHFQ